MIVQNPLRCDSCDGITLTRTAIGHRSRQTHRFPCPGCGIEIVYAVLLDQDVPDFRFDRPRNGHWLTDVDDTSNIEYLAALTFDSELLADRKGVFSPFLTAKSRFYDYGKFERDEELRHYLRTTLWDALRQLLSHFETRQDDLFDRVAKAKFACTPDGDARIDRLSVLHDQTARLLHMFTFEVDEITMEAGRRIEEAYRTDKTLLQELAETIVSNGLAAELWRQIHDLHREFMDVWESLSPVLNLRYWTREPTDLTQFSVTSKDFERIRHFYLSCYETISQISILAIGVEAIAHRRQLSIPTRKGSLSLIPRFAELPNANKAAHLAKHPPLDRIFVPYMTAEIRNGIGHNAASYEFSSDEVVCRKSSSGTIKETYRENYTLFCRRVLDLVSSIIRLEIYLYMMLMLVEGEYWLGDRPSPDASPSKPPRGIESSAEYRTI